MPPVADTEAEPPRLQTAFEITVAVAEGALMTKILTEPVVVQPALSVTVTEWLPPERLVAVAVV